MTSTDIPASWLILGFDEVFSQISISGKKVKSADVLTAGKFPVVDQGRNFISGYLDDANLVVSENKPLIIFGDHTREVKWIDFPFIPGADGVQVLKPHPEMDTRFLYFFLRNLRIESRGYARHFKIVKDAAYLVPPLAEQTRIAAKLDDLLSQVDTLKTRIDGIPTLFKRFRQSVLAAAVSGRLTEEWRKENHAPDFQQTTVGKLFKLIDGDRGPNYPKKNDYQAHGHCLFLSTKNVRKYGFAFDEKQFISKEKHQALRAGLLSRGDIIITTRGTLGNVALYDESVPFDVVRINSGMLILRNLEPDLKNEFFKILIASPPFQKLIESQRSGSAQPQLPAKIIREFHVSVPSVKEQFEIARRAEQLFAFADQLETRVAAALVRIQRLTQSILAKAFRGELMPQDPTDEPASVLLERIKIRRATAPKARRGRQAAQ